MGLESGTYINSLNASNPVSTDGIAQADDHLRLIKSTVKSSFPGITGPVTSSHTELNKLDGVSASTAEINKLTGFTGTVADLNYAKDLRATGVTNTEFDYLDGVTSNIQTQLNAKQATITNNTARGYTSTTSVWPGNGLTTTLSHSLGAFPSFVMVFAEFISASSAFGWTAGERVQISSHVNGSGSASGVKGCTISFDATNVYVSVAQGGLTALNKQSGSIDVGPVTWTSTSGGGGPDTGVRLIVNAYT